MVRRARFRRLAPVLALAILLVGARNPGETPAPPAATPQEVTVIGVFSDQRGQHGVLHAHREVAARAAADAAGWPVRSSAIRPAPLPARVMT